MKKKELLILANGIAYEKDLVLRCLPFRLLPEFSNIGNYFEFST